MKLPSGEWARSVEERANAFLTQLNQVFQPFSKDPSIPQEEDDIVINNWQSALLQSSAITKTTISDVTEIIKSLKPKKSPEFDLITGRIIKKLPENVVTFLTYMLNATLKLKYFPLRWKVAKVILIQKPGKPPTDTCSYRPRSFLPILSKALEIIFSNKTSHWDCKNNSRSPI